jgi:hypothetical protein
MMLYLKQGSTVTVKVGPFLNATDGVTLLNNLTIRKADVRLSKNGAAFGAAHADQGGADAGAPYDENGWYSLALDDTDTGTVGRLQLAVHETGALPVWVEYTVLPGAVYDALVGGNSYLPAAVEQITSQGLDFLDADERRQLFLAAAAGAGHVLYEPVDGNSGDFTVTPDEGTARVLHEERDSETGVKERTITTP